MSKTAATTTQAASGEHATAAVVSNTAAARTPAQVLSSLLGKKSAPVEDDNSGEQGYGNDAEAGVDDEGMDASGYIDDEAEEVGGDGEGETEEGEEGEEGADDDGFVVPDDHVEYEDGSEHGGEGLVLYDEEEEEEVHMSVMKKMSDETHVPAKIKKKPLKTRSEEAAPVNSLGEGTPVKRKERKRQTAPKGNAEGGDASGKKKKRKRQVMSTENGEEEEDNTPAKKKKFEFHLTLLEKTEEDEEEEEQTKVAADGESADAQKPQKRGRDDPKEPRHPLTEEMLSFVDGLGWLNEETAKVDPAFNKVLEAAKAEVREHVSLDDLSIIRASGLRTLMQFCVSRGLKHRIDRSAVGVTAELLCFVIDKTLRLAGWFMRKGGRTNLTASDIDFAILTMREFSA